MYCLSHKAKAIHNKHTRERKKKRVEEGKQNYSDEDIKELLEIIAELLPIPNKE